MSENFGSTRMSDADNAGDVEEDLPHSLPGGGPGGFISSVSGEKKQKKNMMVKIVNLFSPKKAGTTRGTSFFNTAQTVGLGASTELSSLKGNLDTIGEYTELDTDDSPPMEIINQTTVFLLFKDEMSEILQTELQEKWQDFIASLSRHIQDNTIKMQAESFAIDEKIAVTLDDGEVVQVLRLNVPHGLLEYQAALDNVKVQIKPSAISQWINSDDMGPLVEKPMEKLFLFPSTHLIYVPYEARLKHVIRPSQENAATWLTDVQQIWLIESLFDLNRLVDEGTLLSFFSRHGNAMDTANLKMPMFVGNVTTSNYTLRNMNEVKRQFTGGIGEAFAYLFSLVGLVYSREDTVENDIEDTSAYTIDPDIFDRIRNYYGEQVALYFRFVLHLAKWSVPLGLLGLLCQFYIIFTMKVESPLIAVYAGTVLIWANLFTEIWKRTEKDIVFRWGMEGYEDSEGTRYFFEGIENEKDYVTGAKAKHPRYVWNTIKRIVSLLITISFMGCVLYTTFMVYSFKAYLQVKFVDLGIPSTYSSTCASFLNTAQIMVFSILYTYVAEILNDFENHRTQTEYEDSLITKSCMFSFFNSYVSFFYIAFIAGNMSVSYGSNVDDEVSAAASTQCGVMGCMYMLSENLLIVLLTSLTVDKFQEFVLPFIILILPTPINIWNYTQGTGDLYPKRKFKDHVEKSFMEELQRPVYDFQNRLADYTTLFVLFGYVVLFSPALPAASMFVAVSTALECSLDLGKLFSQYRRVQPNCVEDIGAWQGAFELITIIGVVSNSGLIVFTMGMFSEFTIFYQVWIFISMQYLMFTMLSVGGHLIEDIPFEIQIQRERAAHYMDKLKPLYDKTMDAKAVKNSLKY